MGGGDNQQKQSADFPWVNPQMQMTSLNPPQMGSLIPYSGGQTTQVGNDTTEQGHFERLMNDLEKRMRARAGVGEIGWADTGGYQF